MSHSPMKFTGQVLRLSPEQMVELYQAGKSSLDIAAAARCSPVHVLDIVRAHGVEVRPASQKGKSRKTYAITPEDGVRRYQAGETLEEVATAAKCVPSTVRSWLDAAGVPARTAVHSTARSVNRRGGRNSHPRGQGAWP